MSLGFCCVEAPSGFNSLLEMLDTVVSRDVAGEFGVSILYWRCAYSSAAASR